jgi:hypothetical protein
LLSALSFPDRKEGLAARSGQHRGFSYSGLTSRVLRMRRICSAVTFFIGDEVEKQRDF